MLTVQIPNYKFDLNFFEITKLTLKTFAYDQRPFELIKACDSMHGVYVVCYMYIFNVHSNINVVKRLWRLYHI